MDNDIKLYFHCKKCCSENNPPEYLSMKEYSSLSCGWTEKGLQVWCNRHNCNVANLDFMGQKIAYANNEVEDASE